MSAATGNLGRRSPPRRVIPAASIDDVADAIVVGRSSLPQRAMLVAVSGIDGSGKSRLAADLCAAVAARGLRAALVGIDPWQNPQTVRFGGTDPGLHFYHHAIRFEALFADVVAPLVRDRRLSLDTVGIRTDRDAWEPLVYAHEDVDVVVLEGILLLRRDLRHRYDLRVWIECSFDTALRRALARNVENLPDERLREDYARIYHAAQRWHYTLDSPREHADLIVPNERDGAPGRTSCAHE